MTAAAPHTAGSVRTSGCAAGISAPCHDVAADLGSTWATRPTPRRGSHPSAANEAACARAQVAAVVRLSCRPHRSQLRFASHALRSEARPADRSERVFARVANQVFHSVEAVEAGRGASAKGGGASILAEVAHKSRGLKTRVRSCCMGLPIQDVPHPRRKILCRIIAGRLVIQNFFGAILTRIFSSGTSLGFCHD
jgi:hypothetical protein